MPWDDFLSNICPQWCGLWVCVCVCVCVREREREREIDFMDPVGGVSRDIGNQNANGKGHLSQKRRWWNGPQTLVMVPGLTFIPSLLDPPGLGSWIFPWNASFQHQVGQMAVDRSPGLLHPWGKPLRQMKLYYFLNKSRVSLSVFFPWSAIYGAFLSRTFFWLTWIPHVMIWVPLICLP